MTATQPTPEDLRALTAEERKAAVVAYVDAAVTRFYDDLTAFTRHWPARTDAETHLIRIFTNGPIAAWDERSNKP